MLTVAFRAPFLRRQRKGEWPWQTWNVQKADLTGGSDVHAEELHERHKEKEVLTNQSREEDESPSLNKPGRKALMEGAVSVVFERYQLHLFQ